MAELRPSFAQAIPARSPVTTSPFVPLPLPARGLPTCTPIFVRRGDRATTISSPLRRLAQCHLAASPPAHQTPCHQASFSHHRGSPGRTSRNYLASPNPATTTISASLADPPPTPPEPPHTYSGDTAIITPNLLNFCHSVRPLCAPPPCAPTTFTPTSTSAFIHRKLYKSPSITTAGELPSRPSSLRPARRKTPSSTQSTARARAPLHTMHPFTHRQSRRAVRHGTRCMPRPSPHDAAIASTTTAAESGAPLTPSLAYLVTGGISSSQL